MSSNNRDISVSTTRNSDGQLISSQSIDGIKYYTYKFHLFIKSHDNTNFLQMLKVDGSFLKDLLYFVKLSFLITPTAGDLNKYINGNNQNCYWYNVPQGQDVLELVTTKQVHYLDFMVSWPRRAAGWCIYEDDVLVYKDVVNFGASQRPYNSWYHYPLNNGNLPPKLLPIENRVGQGWRLIRQLAPKADNTSDRWYPGDLGFTYVNEDEQLLFTTGDCSYWCITTRSDIHRVYGGRGNVAVIDSNFGQTNMFIYNRTGNAARDPIIDLKNQSDQIVWRMYFENSNSQYSVNNIHVSGMYVYARSTKIVPNPNIFRYKFNMSIRSSHPRNDMVIYTSNTIKIDGVFLEEYLHLESYITNYVNDIYDNYIHWRTDYNVYFGKDVIEIVTTSKVTNFQIKYVHKSMVPGLKIYENDNLVYQDVTNGGSTTGSIWINYPLNNPSTTPIPPTRYHGQYKQITTSYDGVTDQVSSSSESYIHALTSSYSIDGNGSTVENLSNHKNELINIITTTVPDAENIITIINEDKQTNSITTTIKENDATKAVEDTIKKVIIENPQNSLGVQITIESNFETDLKSILTINHIDTSEFVTRTVLSLLSDDTFISWIEETGSYTNPEENQEFERKIKDESGTTTVNVQIVTTIIDGFNNTKTVQTVNTVDKSDFETRRIVTDSSNNDAFISWSEESETIVNGNVEEVTTVEKDENGNFLRIETTSTDSTANSVSLLEKDVFPGTTFVDSDRKVLPPVDIPSYNSWTEPAVFNNNYFFINHSTGSYMDGEYKVRASSVLLSNPNRIPTFAFDHREDHTNNLYASEENTFDANGVITSNHPDGVIIEIVLPDSLSISYYTLQPRNAYLTQMCKKWVFEASTNNVDWILLDSRENEAGWSSLEKREYYVQSSSSYENKRPPYRYYRWRILETNGSSLVAIFGIKLYGFIYSSKLTTTITNGGDGSKTITESFTNLSSVTTETDSSGTVKYVINNNQTDVVFSDGSYPVLNINDPNFTYSQPFQPYHEIIHTQKYEPTNNGFIEDRLTITHKNDSSQYLTCFRFNEIFNGSDNAPGYIMTEGSRAQVLLRDYVKLKDPAYFWFISFIFHPTSSISSYNRIFDIIWNKGWPGAGTTQSGMQIVGRGDDRKMELRWYQNTSAHYYTEFISSQEYILNQDNVIAIQYEFSSGASASRCRMYINGNYAGYRDVLHYNATDSGANLVYIREIMHADMGTGYQIKDVLYGKFTRDFDNRNLNYIRTLTERRHDLVLQDVDIYQEYISS